MNQVETMATQTNSRKTTAADYISHGIVQIFVDLAEEADHAGEEVNPMVLFRAQNYLLKCWDRYLEEKATQ